MDYYKFSSALNGSAPCRSTGHMNPEQTTSSILEALLVSLKKMGADPDMVPDETTEDQFKAGLTAAYFAIEATARSEGIAEASRAPKAVADVQAASDLMRSIDAYACDYQVQGKTGPSRSYVENNLRRLISRLSAKAEGAAS